MTVLFFIILYLAIAAGFALWDSFIGMPVEWDPNGNNNAPRWLGALAWPISTPIVLLIAFSEFLQRAKDKRINRENQRERLRIAAEKEEQTLLQQVEKELEENTFHARKN